MKCGVRVALALGGGYLLGRSKIARRGAKKLALGRAVKKLVPGDLAGALGPQVTEIVDTIRGDLLDAARSAATDAVISRVDSLTGTLHDRADALRNPGAAAAGAGEAAGRLRRRGRRVGSEEETGPEDYDDEPDLREEERRGGRRRGEAPRARRAPSEPGEEYEQDEDEEPEDEADEAPADDAGEPGEAEAAEPAPRRGRAARSPVSRTRR